MAEIPTARAHETVVSATDAPALLKRVSWGAIFAGAFIALALTFLLGLLGSAWGFRAIDPQESSAFSGVGIGAAIWWIVTSIIALGIGGWVAGRLCGIPDKWSATAHGATVWAVVTVFTLWMAGSTVGTVLNTATSAVSGATSTVVNAGQVAADATGPVNVNTQEIQDQIDQITNQVGNVDTQALREDAARTTEQALDALSTAAWYAFFASLLSFAAAVIGAGMGAPHRTFVTARDEINRT